MPSRSLVFGLPREGFTHGAAYAPIQIIDGGALKGISCE